MNSAGGVVLRYLSCGIEKAARLVFQERDGMFFFQFHLRSSRMSTIVPHSSQHRYFWCLVRYLKTDRLHIPTDTFNLPFRCTKCSPQYWVYYHCLPCLTSRVPTSARARLKKISPSLLHKVYVDLFLILTWPKGQRAHQPNGPKAQKPKCPKPIGPTA